jgi:hypothetical protein
MEIWWLNNDIPAFNYVDTISEDGKKVVFKNKDNDYIGSRVDCICFHKENLYLLSDEIDVTLDRDNLSCLISSIAPRVKNISYELSLLKISKIRNLTLEEQACLPYNLQKYNREELQDHIDPWITYLEDYRDLLKKLIQKQDELINRKS